MALSREERNARVRAARAAKADALEARGLARSLAYGKAPKGGATLSSLGLDARVAEGRQRVAEVLAGRMAPPRGTAPSRSTRLGRLTTPRATTFNDQMTRATGIRHLYSSTDQAYLVGRLRQAARDGHSVSIRATFDTATGPRTMSVGEPGQHKAMGSVSGRPIGKVQIVAGPNPSGKGGATRAADILARMDEEGWDLWDYLVDEWEDGWDQY